MDNLIASVTAETIALFPQVSREVLREMIADNLAKILVERQLRELRQRAIEKIREVLLPSVDLAIAEALAAVEHEDDVIWAKWEKVIGDSPLEN